MEDLKRKHSEDANAESAKRVKLLETEQEERVDYFTALNDDCIFEIFQHLSLNELCAVNGACKRLQHLAANHFRRKYRGLQAKSVVIERKNGQIGFHGPDKYIDCFSEEMRRISLYFTEMNDELLEFMQFKLDEKLFEIEFYGLNWSKAFSDGIAAFIQHLVVVRLNDYKNQSNLCVDSFLNNLSHLRKLTIYGSEKFIKKINWQRVECQKLEIFECRIYNSTVIKRLEDFFRKNLTIAVFKSRMSRPTIKQVKNVLKTVVNFENIQAFAITFDGGAINFTSIRSELEMIDERKSLKRFALDLRYVDRMTGFSELTTVKSLTELHLSDPRYAPNYLDGYISVLSTLVGLKILNLDCYLSEANATELANSLQSLERVCFTTGNVAEVLKSFAKHAPKLQEIRISQDFDTKVDLAMLNANRRKLKDAVKLNIVTISSTGVPNYERLNNMNYDLVDLKSISKN